MNSSNETGDPRVMNVARQSYGEGYKDIMKSAFAWVHSYGSLAVFLLVMLGIVGIPIPDETLLLLSAI